MSCCYTDIHDWDCRSRRGRQHTDQTRSARTRLSGLSRKSWQICALSHRLRPGTGNTVYEPSAGILWSLPLWGAAGNDRDGRPRSAGDVASRRAGNSAIRRRFSSSPRHLAAETLASAIAFSLAALLARLACPPSTNAPASQSRATTQGRSTCRHRLSDGSCSTQLRPSSFG